MRVNGPKVPPLSSTRSKRPLPMVQFSSETERIRTCCPRPLNS